jgi:glutamine amidotransferase
MIGIVYYGAGNIFSLTAALDRLGLSYGMIHNAADFEKYDRYIIPGVGHAGTAMQKLNDSGLIPSIIQQKKPVLGICVGMQLLSNHSEEGESTLMAVIPLETRLSNDFSIFTLALSSIAGIISKSITFKPAVAQTCAMPLPIVPAPAMAIVCISFIC